MTKNASTIEDLLASLNIETDNINSSKEYAEETMVKNESTIMDLLTAANEETDNVNASRDYAKSREYAEETKWDGRVCVRDLSPRTTEDGLKIFLYEYGEVTNCYLVYDEYKYSKCYGFATFENPTDGEKLVREAKSQKLMLDGNQISVSFANRKDFSTAKKENHTIFVEGMASITTEDSLRNYFKRFGEVKSTKILRDVDVLQTKSRGEGFVVFVEEEAAETILAGRKEHEIDGKIVKIKWAVQTSTGTGFGVFQEKEVAEALVADLTDAEKQQKIQNLQLEWAFLNDKITQDSDEKEIL